MDHCLCVCELLKAASALSERKLNEVLSDLGLSHCQAQILNQIKVAPVSMSHLSKALCCHKSNITQVVDGLNEKGLIERVPSLTDKRVCALKLTSKGRKTCLSMEGILHQQATECMKIFTPKEKQILADLLRKYVQHQSTSSIEL